MNRESGYLVGKPWVGRTGQSDHPLDLDYIRTNIPCQWACPAKTNIPGYIEQIYQGNVNQAYQINQQSNLFPGVLGRICSRPCELACRHGDMDLGEPVSICYLKRFASDQKTPDHILRESMFAESGKSVGIVGAGPAGLAVAHSLAIFGHRVALYEQMPTPGGMLKYGIPAFRLPRTVIDREIYNVLRLGVDIEFNRILGRDFSIPELLSRHDAVVLAAGCYAARNLGIPGETLPGVWSGLDFMMRINRGETPSLGARVIVLGGGFTAMDCARSARRLGSDEVFVCIRNVEEDLTVTREEVVDVKREGIRFVSLVSSLEVVGHDRASGVRFARNRFGGVRGRQGRAIIPIDGSEFVLDADTVIAAIGQGPEKSLYNMGMSESVVFDSTAGGSNVTGLFGAGDFVRGASTVIESIGHGRTVAVSVDTFLMNRTRRRRIVSIQPASDTQRKRAWDFIPRRHMSALDLPERFKSQDAEVELGFEPEAGQAESQRCYLCNLKYEIHIPDCIYCRLCIEACPRNCIELGHSLPDHTQTATLLKSSKWNDIAGIVIDSDRCIRCGECFRVCPTECIHVTRIDLQDRLLTGEG